MEGNKDMNKTDLSKGMDEKIEDAAEMPVREEDMGAREMDKRENLSGGMNSKIEEAGAMKGREEDMGASEKGK